MNKREKQESSTREKKVKRVKTHHARPNILSLASVNIDCFRLEEAETIEDCHLKFKETCDKIRKHFHSILLAKQRNGDKSASIEDHRTDICLLVMCLKKLNRLDKHQWKKSRDAVNERKQKVDALNLQYQNLLYEVTHLQKEVTKCLEFRSKDEEIELVSVDEFYKDAPESISNPKVTKVDPHELTMARLMWELEQRKQFALKLKEAEIAKEEHKQKIKKLKDQLSNVLPTLQSIIEAAEPLQSKLGMPFQAMHVKHKAAKFLPKPLYILYLHACAYRESLDRKIQIAIEGNIDEAKNLQLKTEDLSEESGESDQEENVDLSMHRRSVTSRKDDTSKDIFKKHPMTVLLTVESKDAKIILEFKYLFHLQIVTVSVVSVSPQHGSSDALGNLLKWDTFLNCLFPGDTGRETPNHANQFLLRKFGCEEMPFANETTGWPYVWAQHVSGLGFLTPQDEEITDMKRQWKLSFYHIENTVQSIRSRLISRFQLRQQIISLDQRFSIPDSFAALYPQNVSTQVKKWMPIEFKEAMNYANAEELVELNIISEDVMMFKAEIQRGSALMVILVAIPPDYPGRTPVFLLQLFWKGSHTAVTNGALRELEEEVNVHFVENLPEEFKSNLLVCQMHHLVVCFDVFLETESCDSFEGVNEFKREKVVARSSRGRSHSRPYKCISTQGIFTFR
ncbi:THO complex subunit 5 homolog B-like [Uloborus diversus]|uniref:THO complex subunit 5 homolog B-like n=1 Tax=Uloborus diversus TaxID=327109 RepID=UPI002409CF91|nr:THO complex subunit 5 homolog B-like [Uloborus diversus]